MKSFIKSLKNSEKPKWLGNINFQLFICSLILFLVAHFIYSWTEFSFEYDYVVGSIVKEDIVLQSDYIDVKATNIIKENVKYDVEDITTIDGSVYALAKENISDFYNEAYEIRAEHAEDEVYLIRVFKHFLKEQMELSVEELGYLASMDEIELRLTESYIYDVLKEILSSGVTDENIIKQKQRAEVYFENLDQLSEEVKPIIAKIVNIHVIPNSHRDDAATEKLIDEMVSKVENVVKPAGSVIGTAGEPLDIYAYNVIAELGLNEIHTFEQKLPLLSMDVFILLILVVMSIVLSQQYHAKSKQKKVKNKEIYLNFSIMLFMFLVTFGFNSLSPYMLPIAVVAMIISILEDPIIGITYSFFLTVLYGVLFGLPVEIISFTMLGCMISAISVYKVFQRGRIFLAGLSVSLINAMVIIALSFIAKDSVSVALENTMYGVLSGLLCSIITIGSLPLWESLFKSLTPLKLLELANPNHPLLKKMLLEAPGTYHHSILVANLSEGAAHDIDADPLLARVGAYFHDVGKLERPFLYMENQYDGHNPHDLFVPRVSAQIIKDHIKRGLALGKKYKLPKEILEFIEQHHGTTMIKYFYHKAKENAEEEAVDQSAYTYEGPKPLHKEIAIVMLADSVEAAVRSLKKPDKDSVKTLIHKIVQGKIREQQLNDCDLTLKEIELITNSFVSSLSSAFHERIEYPEMEETEHQLNIIK